MKVRDINQLMSETHERHAVIDKHPEPDSKKMFQRQINAVSNEARQKYIEDMRSKITQQGEIVKDTADMKELQEYRRLIAELLNETVNNSFDCSKSNILDCKGRHKTLVIIRNINQTLDALTKEILAEQTDNIKLLGMVDDIKGMLVDLFL